MTPHKLKYPVPFEGNGVLIYYIFWADLSISSRFMAESKSKRLCYRKWLMLFSLKFQRDNRQNTLAVDPAKGKTG